MITKSEENKIDTQDKLKVIIELLESKKAVDIQTIDLTEKTLMCDYFVICSGTSNVHIRTLCDTLTLDGRKRGLKKRNIEGRSNAKWILIDFKDIIVHIFDPAEREYYNLEELWQNFEPAEQES